MDNIKLDHRDNGIVWIVAQDREHGNELSGSIKCWEVLE
jgi:hypothetical protein